MRKILLPIKLVPLLLLFSIGVSFSQSSINEYTGLWIQPSTWIAANMPGTVDLQNITVTINGRVTRNGDLSFKNNANLEVSDADTLIVTGNLVFKGNTNLTIQGNGLLIVLGNLTSQNNINVVSSGKLVVVGSFSTGNGTNVSNSGDLYIFGTDAIGTGGSSNYSGSQPGDALDLAANDRELADYLINELGVTNAALPIELKFFTSKIDHSSVHLQWITAKEENFSHFEVERSVDMKHFEMIGMVQGQGESLSDVKYDLSDSDAPFGVIYYRLKAVDIDDTFDYSPVVQILNCFRGEVNVYPNPADQTDKIMLKLPASFKGSINHIVIYDMQGAKRKEFFNYDSAKELSFGNEIKSGLYLIKIEHNGINENIRVLIK